MSAPRPDEPIKEYSPETFLSLVARMLAAQRAYFDTHRDHAEKRPRQQAAMALEFQVKDCIADAQRKGIIGPAPLFEVILFQTSMFDAS